MLINQYIKKIRTDLEMGQDEFAVRIGLTRSNLSQIERGKSKPTYITLKKIVNEFHIDANLFFNAIKNYEIKEQLQLEVKEGREDYNNHSVADLLDLVKSQKFVIELLKREIEQLKYIEELMELNDKLDEQLKQNLTKEKKG